MKNYKDMPSVGYWPDLGGVEVKEIENSHVLVVAGAMSSAPTSHRLKIYGKNDYENLYIILNGRRLKLSECKWLFKTVYCQ